MFLMIFLQEGLEGVQIRGDGFRRDTVVLEIFFYKEMKVDFRKCSFFQFFPPRSAECGDIPGDCFLNVVGVGFKVGRCDWGEG